MPFFSKLKRALGFGVDPAYDDDLFSDTESDEQPDDSASSAVKTDTDMAIANQGVDEAACAFSEQMRSRIFDHVVEVFNGAMPEFIRNSVDVRAQSNYIYNTLDDSIKAYFDSYEAAIDRKFEQMHAVRNHELSAEITRLRDESKRIDDDRMAIKERQLSADRQKRALHDRVHELEQQLATLDAEREQLQLENRSMLNKIKVAAVQGAVDEEQARYAAMEEENANLKLENARLKEAIDKQTDMHNISEAMMGDLRQSAAKAREDFNSQQATLDATVKELEQTRSRLAEAEAIVAEAKTINDQLGVLMTELDKRENRIAKLKKEKAELRNRIEILQEAAVATEVATAYGSDNAAPEATPEFGPGDETKTSAPQEKKIQLPAPGPRMPRITDDTIDSIDEQFDNETWTIDSHESSKPTIEKEAQRSSRRKHTPADDAQLSLF